MMCILLTSVCREGKPKRVAGTKDSMLGHIKVCLHLTEEQKELILASTTGSSGASSSSKRQALLIPVSVADTPLDDDALELFHRKILRMTLVCNMSFNWVEQPIAKELFRDLRPGATLPSRKKMSGVSISMPANKQP